jgi:hypothetical protein
MQLQAATTQTTPPVHVHVHLGPDNAVSTQHPSALASRHVLKTAKHPSSVPSPVVSESDYRRLRNSEEFRDTRIMGLLVELLDFEGLRNDDDEDPIAAARDVVEKGWIYRDLKFKRRMEWEVSVMALGEPFCLLVMLMVRKVHRPYFRYIQDEILDPMAYALAALRNIQLGRGRASVENTLSQIDAVCVVRNKLGRLEKEARRRVDAQNSRVSAKARDSEAPKEAPAEKPPTDRQIAKQDRQDEKEARRNAADRPVQTGGAPAALGALGAVVAAVKQPAPPPNPEPEPEPPSAPEPASAVEEIPDPEPEPDLDPTLLEDMMAGAMAEKLVTGFTNEDILFRPETFGTLVMIGDTPLIEAVLPRTGLKRKDTLRQCHAHLLDKHDQFARTPEGSISKNSARAGIGIALRTFLGVLVEALRDNGYAVADVPEKPPLPEPEKGRKKGRR